MNCPFCNRIASGDYEETDVSGVVTFVPLRPVTPGHRLFAPRIHVASAWDGPREAAACVRAAAKHQSAGSANIITSIGQWATQTVSHLHVHLVPRRENDGLHLPWTDRP